MRFKYLTTVVFFGLSWGFLEALLGGALHAWGLPVTGTVMASLGFAILYTALRAGVSINHLFGVSLIAAGCKFFDTFLFHLPFADILIINPAAAIASQGLAMTVLFRKKWCLGRAAFLAPRFFAAGAFSLLVFNLNSVIFFGWTTGQTIMPFQTVLIHLPLLTVLSTCSALGIARLFKPQTLRSMVHSDIHTQ